jgi:excisionase family DNA binding protein
MPEPLLSTANIAGRLKLNIETVNDSIARHQLPACKIGGQWRFQEAEVRNWLEKHNVAQL